jgi:hypothetical protein
MTAAAQQGDGIHKGEQAPAAATSTSADLPRFIFSGYDEASRSPETFSLSKEKGIATFTIYGPNGQLKYVTNTLRYVSTTANAFAIYEAEGLGLEYAFLTQGPQYYVVYTRIKGNPVWQREGSFGRYLPSGNYF